jgi:hypothetical protein
VVLEYHFCWSTVTPVQAQSFGLEAVQTLLACARGTRKINNKYIYGIKAEINLRQEVGSGATSPRSCA